MISEKAYEVLKRRKRKNESFTDVILRLGSEKGSVAKLLELVQEEDFEPISSETARQMKEASSEFRKNFKLRNEALS
jgi:predicted CopG family antitoxin